MGGRNQTSIVLGGRMPFWVTEHATWADVKASAYDWAVECARAEDMGLIDFVTRARAYPKETAAALSDHLKLRVTVGQVLKWCKRFLPDSAPSAEKRSER